MHADNPKHCAHIRYGMTCSDLDELRQHTEDRCQICRQAGTETSHGFLVIDHDRSIGRWAVRGLLCSRCNTMLDSHQHVLDQDAVERYLASPWYLLQGVDPEPPEPPVGTCVRLPNRVIMRRIDSQPGSRWMFDGGPGGYTARMRAKTWQGFCQFYGPQNLRIVPARSEREAAEREAVRVARAAKKEGRNG
jgi:hypothetical protein